MNVAMPERGSVKLTTDSGGTHDLGMNSLTNPYAGYRYPPEIIARAVWLYHRFCLSLRDVEDLLAERGVIVSHETIRQWRLKFGQSFAKRLRRRQGRPGDTWFLDEVFITIGGELRYLWRALDQDGDVLDIYEASEGIAVRAMRDRRRQVGQLWGRSQGGSAECDAPAG